MNGSVNEVLRGIVERHGQVLLEDHRRCESCLRDSSLAPKEISAIVAALKAGIPKRIAAMPAVGDKGVANFAAELAEASGLSEQLALTSVAAWAFALQPQRVEKYEKKDDKKAMQQDETAVSKASVPSLSEAIVAAIVIPVICYGAYVFGTFKVFGFEVPAWIFALIVVVKGGQSIGSYLSFRFGMKA
ncbi:hypothetical protein [Chelatococcus asaccharovorans]|uniref:hypothetical protein n=1 Tax=Chelatococcus asaccharovorans TaxID=28210 RepID=UPI00224C78C0|nr:hypothetical protein [Chelatococcus asaccharovorans]CAH1648955.1 conserved hypothetical protein [Chelatococcus asaccharovorans]CAH1687269.1 conserved hypothetical protein [Chelatococcus asaccharovorans]